MEWLVGAFAVVIVIFLLSRGTSEPSPPEKISKKASEDIRKGYRIFVSTMSVQGVQFRKDAANQFINDSNQRLILEAEPNNQSDVNAIKIIGEGNRGRCHLGYVPKDVALKLAKTECLPFVYARLMRTYRSEQNYIDITFQIVGLKDKKEQFDNYELNIPMTSIQKTYLKFWKIGHEENITTFAADKLISEHYKNAEKNEPEKWLDWQRMEFVKYLYDYFCDKDEREQFDIKKPTKKQIEVVVGALLEDGVKLDVIQDDYQIFVDKLTELYPELER
jgi:hypothetical protein